ncbi:hypothetical protein CASFOL_014742 [Castilleja foliolosa]|uniref:AAA+ ATPase domain-containing protein n=1 Tax=Castilleja foliolosa TaxID=1961234 RepID=A0ABD3DF97_9LAMI
MLIKIKNQRNSKTMITSMIELITQVGSSIAGLMFAVFQKYFPHELRGPLNYYSQKILNFFNPYVHVTFPEYSGDGFSRSPAFTAIERYLNANSTSQAKNLKAHVARDSETTPNRQSITFYPREDQKRFYRLTFHRRHREIMTTKYLTYVLSEGKSMIVKERKRKLYTNIKNGNGSRRKLWNHVIFEHPASFDTLAMEPEKKKDIVDDLLSFANSKDYYAKIGKAWKRGYLLFGPPGTGKSTMIAAMANLLKYDVYDIELTAVKDNTELRKLLIDTSNKSVIVIEDIDCSMDLTGQRKKKKNEENEDGEEEKDEVGKLKKKLKKREASSKGSKVTLSGLLNFIDGLWSACGSERIIVFTTNYVEKLDPALIRRGRMDKHIELSYCGLEAFKVLAKNYLDIEEHDLFGSIERMLKETGMTPADVAENLMPKMGGDQNVEICLLRLIKALVKAKQKARIKAEEEEKRKAEKLAKQEEKKKKKMVKEMRKLRNWIMES